MKNHFASAAVSRPTRLTTLAPGASAGEDGVDRYAWLDKEKLLPGQDWELEICKVVRVRQIAIV